MDNSWMIGGPMKAAQAVSCTGHVLWRTVGARQCIGHRAFRRALAAIPRALHVLLVLGRCTWL